MKSQYAKSANRELWNANYIVCSASHAGRSARNWKLYCSAVSHTL